MTVNFLEHFAKYCWTGGVCIMLCLICHQSVVGLRDLGQFRRQPFEDSTGSVIFVAVHHITDAKNVNKSVYVRWTTLNKLQPSLSLGLAYDSDTSAFDIVAAAVKVRSSPAVRDDTLSYKKNLNYCLVITVTASQYSFPPV